jgi:polysaccharide deacetylase family protein (PEP-CTERM system associated)
MPQEPIPAVLSFDIEEHHRIEAAVGLDLPETVKGDYHRRMCRTTGWILEQLAERSITATFFILGDIALESRGLIRSIHEAGHEVASHGWNHSRIHTMSPEVFREDVRRSKDALEQASGAAVVGYRAPTFSVVRKTAWALDILPELGMLYDSSIYPVHHDRYGIPEAPRGPFLARGTRNQILELPPATVRLGGVNLPIGGGGYFRMLPWLLLKLALEHSRRDPQSGATVLYFHPWEFDHAQPRLPLARLNRLRTYTGIRSTEGRLASLLSGRRWLRAVDLARGLLERPGELPCFWPVP